MSGKFAAEVAKELEERRKIEEALIRKEKVVSNFMNSYFEKKAPSPKKKPKIEEKKEEPKKEKK